MQAKDIAVKVTQNWIGEQDWSTSRCKRQRRDPINFAETPWGLMLQDPELEMAESPAALRFRRRFRFPYPLFLTLVELCEEKEILGSNHIIPLKIKVLACLRILGRGNCADEIAELSSISESHAIATFKTFVVGFVAAYYDMYVYFPEGEELKEVEAAYARMGLPLACGSMDVTHVRLGKCPVEKHVICSGKEKYPSLAFQAIVGPNRRVFHVSNAFYGSFNDITITHNDTVPQQILGGKLKHVKSTLYDKNNVPRVVQGGYLLVDNGYYHHPWLINPISSSVRYEAKVWSEWVESVRKDVECFFGVLKVRFRILQQQIQLHKHVHIEAVFKVACIFHNMLMTYDAEVQNITRRNVDWAALDPVGEDAEVVPYLHEPEHQTIPLLSLPRVNELPVYRSFHPRDRSGHQKLTEMLITHFSHNYRLNAVQWPYQSSVIFRHRLRVTGADDGRRENVIALYERPSTFRTRRTHATIGGGLFSCVTYERNQRIATFNGNIITPHAYDVEKEHGRGNFGIMLSRNEILNCYDQRHNKTCMASVANDSRNCYIDDGGEHVSAKQNCRLVIDRSNERPVAYLKATCCIPAHTEIAWSYGDTFW